MRAEVQVRLSRPLPLDGGWKDFADIRTDRYRSPVDRAYGLGAPVVAAGRAIADRVAPSIGELLR
jgi:hypothetical protein